MATQFSATDRRRIVRALGLERSQLLTGSRLASVMLTTEQYEAQGATGLVDDIRAILDALDEAQELERGDTTEALGPALATGNLPEGVASVSLPNELSLTFQPGSGPGTAAARTNAANIQRLRDLLDPDSILLGVTAGGNILW